MTFAPKSWQNFPDTSTPLSAAALVDLETRLAAYTDGVILNVKNYGAVGNGVTNDSTAIQNALNAAAAVAAADVNVFGQVVIPPGTYKASGLTINQDRVRVIGWGGRIMNRANTDIFTVTANEVEFRGVLIDGNGATNSGNGITAGPSVDFRFTGGRIENIKSGSYCIQFNTVDSTRRTIADSFLNIRGTPAQGAIAFVGAGSGGTLSDFTGNTMITNCWCAGGDLADLSGCATVLITGCDLRNVFFDVNSKKVALVGNRIASSGADTTILGTQHSIVGNIHAGGFVLGSGCTGVIIGPQVSAIHAPTDSSGNPGSNNILTDPSVGTLRVYDRDNGQAGLIVPGYSLPTNTTPLTLSAQRAYVIRFRPTRAMTVSSVGFVLVTAAGSNDNCDVAILDSSYHVQASAGSTAGKLNASANSVQTLTLTGAYTVVPGSTYYVAFSTGTFGGSAATLASPNVGNPWGDIWGSTAGVRELGAQVGYGVPFSTTLTPAQSAAVPFLLITG